MSEWESDPTFKQDDGWESDPSFKPEKQSSGSMAAIRSFANSGSGGFLDETAGVLEGLGQAGGVSGLGGPLKDIHLDPQGPTLDWHVIKDAYQRARDHERKMMKQHKEDHPVVSGVADVAGMIASPLNKILPNTSMAMQGAAIGGANALGNSDASGMDLAKDAAIGGVLGGAAGKVAEKAIPAISNAADWVGKKLGNAAEGFALNATGATGKQASAFADDAGRQLLDRKLVRFGDSPERVAERTGAAMADANKAIDESLKALDAKGVTASADNVVAELQKKVAELKADPSQSGIVKKLNSIIDDIVETGNSKIPISAGEQTKRGFNKMAGNWMEPEVGQAGKTAYQAYRGEVESAAEAAAPELAQKFTDAKKTFGILAPIQEAAERRGFTTRQSPLGGLGDMAAASTGAIAGGPLGAAAGFLGKKVLAPRLSSSTAVTLDKISQSLLKSPQIAQVAKSNPAVFQNMLSSLENKMGAFEHSLPKSADSSPYDKDAILQKTQGSKYGQVMQQAAQNGDQAFSAAHYILSQRDEGYRKQTAETADGEQ